MTRSSTRKRDALWLRCCAADGLPRCNIPGCGLPVRPGERWVESHFPAPRTLGGTATGVAHFSCNFRYWCEVEAPIVAKVKRQRQKHSGAWRTRRPLPGGRDSAVKITMAHGPVERATGKPWKGFRRGRRR